MPSESRAHRGRLYLFAALDELGPLATLYALLFIDNGFSTGQISVVFALWAAVGLLLEVPSGALADRMDRRHLLAIALVFRATGITLWLCFPSFGVLLLGTVLCAVHTTTMSGALEALVHDELSAHGESDDYGPVMARLGQAAHSSVFLSAPIAWMLMRAGVSIHTLGAVTVALNALSIAVVLSLPRTQLHLDGEAPSLADWWATLRSGVHTAAESPSLARMLTVGALIEGLCILDEYMPVLADDRGHPTAAPLLVLAVFGGMLAGGELAARRPNLSSTALGLLLVAGAAASGLGLLSSTAAGVATFGLAYAALNVAWITSDARLQQRVPDETRATVTSVRALFANGVSIALFVIVGLLSSGTDPTPGLLLAIGLLFVTAWLTTRWMPGPSEAQAVST